MRSESGVILNKIEDALDERDELRAWKYEVEEALRKVKEDVDGEWLCNSKVEAALVAAGLRHVLTNKEADMPEEEPVDPHARCRGCGHHRICHNGPKCSMPRCACPSFVEPLDDDCGERRTPQEIALAAQAAMCEEAWCEEEIAKLRADLDAANKRAEEAEKRGNLAGQIAAHRESAREAETGRLSLASGMASWHRFRITKLEAQQRPKEDKG